MKLVALALLVGLALIAASIAITNRITVQPLPKESGWQWLVTDQWTGRVYQCRTPRLFGAGNCIQVPLKKMHPTSENTE